MKMKALVFVVSIATLGAGIWAADSVPPPPAPTTTTIPVVYVPLEAHDALQWDLENFDFVED
jgi:hypothetical protein